MAKHPKSLDGLTRDSDGRIREKVSDPLVGKLREEHATDDDAGDDAYWVEKAIEAEKSGYAGCEKSMEFLLEKLV
jgi:hypothetical protein